MRLHEIRSSSSVLFFIPEDCCRVIDTYLPKFVTERCHMCGTCLVMLDEKGRLHIDDDIICTESLSMCGVCFNSFYA